MRCQRQILQVRWFDFTSNADVIARTELPSLADTITPEPVRSRFPHGSRHSSPRCTRLCHRSSNGAPPTLRLEEASRSFPPHVDLTNWQQFNIVSSPRMDPRHSSGLCDEISAMGLCYPSVLKEGRLWLLESITNLCLSL